MILIVDNNDSFTYNLVQIFEELNQNIQVVFHNNLNSINVCNYKAIILSPGPDTPCKYPQMMNLIASFHKIKPILGICLGHQALASFFGARLSNQSIIKHGIKSKIRLLIRTGIYFGLNEYINVGRYHSWSVNLPLPDNLICTSISEDNIVMSFQHKIYKITGLQYHPESIITEIGSNIIDNWLKSIN